MAKKKQPGTELATMKDLESFYAAEAQDEAKAAPASEGAPRLVAKDFQFSVGERILPDPIALIVVAQGRMNAWYDSEYDPNSKMPPACFAVAENKEGVELTMHAHPVSPVPQGAGPERLCNGCPKNEFGSAERGNGKACANNINLAVVMADDPALQDPRAVLGWAVLTLSPTALAPWGKFVKGLANIEKRPPHGAVITFSFNKQSPKEQQRKAVIATSYKLIGDVSTATRVNALRKEILAGGQLIRPLPVDGYVPVSERGATNKKGKGDQRVVAKKKAKGKR